MRWRGKFAPVHNMKAYGGVNL